MASNIGFNGINLIEDGYKKDVATTLVNNALSSDYGQKAIDQDFVSAI